MSVSIGNATIIDDKKDSRIKLQLDRDAQENSNNTVEETDPFMANFKSERKRGNSDKKKKEKKNNDYSDTDNIIKFLFLT